MDKRAENLKKINEFSCLEYDWNGNRAEIFTKSLINNIKFILDNIEYQPDIFPTARNSIQMEYEKSSGEYLELEIYENGVQIYQIYSNGNETETTLDMVDIDAINGIIKDFCGRTKN